MQLKKQIDIFSTSHFDVGAFLERDEPEACSAALSQSHTEKYNFHSSDESVRPFFIVLDSLEKISSNLTSPQELIISEFVDTVLTQTFYVTVCSVRTLNGFTQSVSRQRLDKHGQRATMEDVSQWTNVIASS
jgi:hypothetical protein